MLPIAVPSWVKPGTVAENAAFLASKVAEVGLCCFEWQASAAMSEAELPASLAALPLCWHVHLPSDLPKTLPTDLTIHWPQNPKSPLVTDLVAHTAYTGHAGLAAAHAALAVWGRVAFLNPRIAVLHLPAFAGGAGLLWLRQFLSLWTQRGLAPDLLAVENVRGASPLDYGPALWELGVSFCLDVAHAMAYGQEELWSDSDFSRQCMQRLRLSHWSAPGAPKGDGSPTDRHLPLTAWTPAQKASILHGISQHEALHPNRQGSQPISMIEVFDWENILRSWPVLQELGQVRNTAQMNIAQTR